MTTILLKLVIGDEYLFYYSLDEASISRCIETHLVTSEPHYDQIARIIADLTAKKLSGKTKTLKKLIRMASDILYELRHYSTRNQLNSQVIFSKQLIGDIKLALYNCAEDNSYELDEFESSELATMGQSNQWLFFSPNTKMLSNCIEYDLIGINSYYKQSGTAKEIANIVAGKFSGKIKPREFLQEEIDSLFHESRIKKLPHRLKIDL